MAKQVIEITGLDELIEDVRKVVKLCPDEAGNELRKMGIEIKKEAISKTKERVRTYPNDKYTLLKNYGVSQVQGVMMDQTVDIFTKSPHFHLIEDGHDVVTPGGRQVGHKEGYDMLKDTVDEYEDKMPDLFRNMVDNILRRNNL